MLRLSFLHYDLHLFVLRQILSILSGGNCHCIMPRGSEAKNTITLLQKLLLYTVRYLRRIAIIYIEAETKWLPFCKRYSNSFSCIKIAVCLFKCQTREKPSHALSERWWLRLLIHAYIYRPPWVKKPFHIKSRWWYFDIGITTLYIYMCVCV